MIKFSKPLFLFAITLAVGALVACSSTPSNQSKLEVIEANPSQPSVSSSTQVKQTPTPPQTKPVTQPKPQPTPTTAISTPTPIESKKYYGSFGDWKADFVERAITQGHSSTSVYQLMNNAKLNNQVIALDGKQAEFAKMPWDYVESAASKGRISQGKVQLNEYPSLLSRIQNQYGVPKEIVVAIWGLESSYGAGTGNTNLVDALSSLAFDGRRRNFAEGELIAMMRMVERGDVTWSQLKGSWAGGMGHTQFIPSTWLQQGVDGNNDGQKNPWTISDALSSTANYLKNSGWVQGYDAYYEVRLPSQFDYNLIGQKLPLDAWKNHGILPINGEYFSGQTLAQLWLPAGIHGPALLTTPNFDVIKVYNNSSSYALGVSLLAKHLAGKNGIIASWPRHERPLSTTQIQRLQHNLIQRGYDVGSADGIAGAKTRFAFARWQADNGKIPDGFISQNSASDLLW